MPKVLRRIYCLQVVKFSEIKRKRWEKKKRPTPSPLYTASRFMLEQMIDYSFVYYIIVKMMYWPKITLGHDPYYVSFFFFVSSLRTNYRKWHVKKISSSMQKKNNKYLFVLLIIIKLFRPLIFLLHSIITLHNRIYITWKHRNGKK